MKRLIAAVSFLLLIVFTNSFAQTTNATLGGTVSDSTGALIPGVTVTATNTQTGIVTTGLTNETGAYNFPSLQTGVYKVTVLVQMRIVELKQYKRMRTVELFSRPERLPRLPALTPVGALAFQS